jgi:hypothetical protein
MVKLFNNHFIWGPICIVDSSVACRAVFNFDTGDLQLMLPSRSINVPRFSNHEYVVVRYVVYSNKTGAIAILYVAGEASRRTVTIFEGGRFRGCDSADEKWLYELIGAYRGFRSDEESEDVQSFIKVATNRT